MLIAGNGRLVLRMGGNGNAQLFVNDGRDGAELFNPSLGSGKLCPRDWPGNGNVIADHLR